MTPSGFEEQKGEDVMPQLAAQAAENAIDKALLKEKDEKITGLEIERSNLEEKLYAQEDQFRQKDELIV